MKKYLFFSLLIIALFQQISAQNNKEALLWRVSGNGLQKPSYLFGTVHLYCAFDKLEQSGLKQYVDSAETVVMELDLNDFEVITSLIKSSMKKSKKPISGFLSKEEYNIVDSACLVILGDSLKNLDERSPMMLLSLFYGSKTMTGCNPIPVDFYVSDLAKKSGTPTAGLESFRFQDSLLSSIPDSIQVSWLVDICQNPEKARTDYESLIRAYENQQQEELLSLSFEISPEMKLLQESFLDARNIRWAEELSKNVHQVSLFVAVGAAHLGGETGLISLLRKKGYILTPIRLNF